VSSPSLDLDRSIGRVVQMGYVVADIDAAMTAFASRLSIGPWFLYRRLPAVGQAYLGRLTALDLAVALTYQGSMMIELIEQRCETASVYHPHVGQPRRHGFHHYGVASRAFDADLERYQVGGHEPLFFAQTPRGNRGVYMTGPEALGGLVELIEVTDASAAFYQRMYLAAADWGGDDPVRPLD
jgi:hypothetical protein